jgi:N-acetyl-gamma-glutamylphosphate reductase
MSRPYVLIVGASGVFGSRLARLLAGRQQFRVTLAGRAPGKSPSRVVQNRVPHQPSGSRKCRKWIGVGKPLERGLIHTALCQKRQ